MTTGYFQSDMLNSFAGDSVIGFGDYTDLLWWK